MTVHSMSRRKCILIDLDLLAERMQTPRFSLWPCLFPGCRDRVDGFHALGWLKAPAPCERATHWGYIARPLRPLTAGQPGLLGENAHLEIVCGNRHLAGPGVPARQIPAIRGHMPAWPARPTRTGSARPDGRGRSNAAIGQRVVITERAVAQHAASIFLRLGLQPSDDDNRRVLAVLGYLSR